MIHEAVIGRLVERILEGMPGFPRQGSGAVVMMSMDDYQALEETAYLLRSPKNMRRLIHSIIELKSGEGNERELIE